MEIREITDKNLWESFMSSQDERTFLNSWSWGEFQRVMGKKIWRLGAFDREELVGTALVSKVMARRGTHLLIQHGPAVTRSKKEVFPTLLKELRALGKKESVSFIRINPLWEINGEYAKLLKNFGFRNAPMHANAYESTWKIDIQPTEEELLQNMRKTTRYLIRQTLKNKDIEIIKYHPYFIR